MLTSVSDVYACGDCVEVEDLLTHKPKLSLKWYNARLQAMVAASNCAGKYREYPGSYEVTFFSTFGVDALSLGSTEAALQARGVNDLEIIEHTSYNHHQHFIIKDAKILGAQLIGHTEHGGSILSIMVRRDNISNIKDFITSRNIAMVPLIRVINNYLRQEISVSPPQPRSPSS